MSIVSRISRLCGWTPLGKAVEIQIEESWLPFLVGRRLRAKLVALNENGSATLELTELIEVGAKAIQFVIAHPRHRGYDFFHIAFGSIAADFSPSFAEQEAATQDTRFAMGLIKVQGRSRDLSMPHRQRRDVG